MSEPYYPPGAFYFSVSVLGSATLLAAASDLDASFQEISGIEARWDTEDVTEGGENRFTHKLPKAAKYSNLVLKRGVVTRDSFLAEWFGQSVGSGLSLPLLPQNILVLLLNEDGLPLVAWGFINAWPLRWEVSPMSSQENRILTESLELSYNYFERVNLGSPASVAVKLAQLTSRLM
ncbi:phage tail protein [Myxococcus sp. CA033]|uniref:phage tail protein n=1 Tax=Myxococcus sp. CA033 TaxID=2741516 RepID=UPI00157B0EC7|nr:phage tail protein [Myxococcus sp. CA033]NTX39330.1 phage tail protein [Myxococcus sp. CA033]